MVATMAEDKHQSEYCTYASLKIDSEVLAVVKFAADLAGQKVQEYVSDIMNEISAKATNRKPVKRRPPRPRRPRRQD